MPGNLALLLEMQTTHNENLYERQTNIHTFLNVKFLKMSIDGLRIHPISKIHQKILPFVGNSPPPPNVGYVDCMQ